VWGRRNGRKRKQVTPPSPSPSTLSPPLPDARTHTHAHTHTQNTLVPDDAQAKSIAFFGLNIEGLFYSYALSVDNLKALAPDGEVAAKVAGKVADAEAEIAEKTDEFRERLMQKVGTESVKTGE